MRVGSLELDHVKIKYCEIATFRAVSWGVRSAERLASAFCARLGSFIASPAQKRLSSHELSINNQISIHIVSIYVPINLCSSLLQGLIE